MFEICIIVHEIYWIKSKPDSSIMKLGPGGLHIQVKQFCFWKSNTCSTKWLLQINMY